MTSAASQLRKAFVVEGLLDTKTLAEGIKSGAYKQALEEQFKEVNDAFEKLSAMPADDATFETLVEPYHALDEELKMAWLFLDQYHKTDGDEVTAALMQEFQPKIVRLSDTMLLNVPFYRLLEAVWDRSAQTLSDAARRSLELMIRDRKIAGVHLSPEKKTRLQEINEKLMELGEKFGRNAVESRKQFFHQFTNEEDVKDFPEQDREGAREEAKKRGLDGWVFTLSQPSRLAISRYCADRSVRKKFLEEGLSVATREPNDNRPLILDILALRKEKAAILGYEDYAGFVLQTRMASDAQSVRAMLQRLQGSYVSKAQEDIDELKAFAAQDELKMWDVGFYSNKLSQKKFSIDESELQKYFELEATLKGMFVITGKLFGIEMHPLPDAPSYDPDVRTFEVKRGGKTVGYFTLDLFVRPTKRTGAWCGYLRASRNLPDGTRVLPFITNTCNFPKATAGKPTLLSHYDVQTLFHEFGHALHQLLSEHAYPNLESFAAELDFVELPSQLLENWCWERESLSLFAKHVDTGEVIPEWLLDALKQKQMFMKGYEGSQQLEYASLDMELHTHAAPPQTVEQLDAFCLAHEREWNVLEVPDFYRMHAGFSHVFEGEYAVGYYSYTWSEVLEADAFGLFEKEGILDATVGDRYRREILAPGALRSGKESFHAFMGREADPSALLRKKGMK